MRFFQVDEMMRTALFRALTQRVESIWTYGLNKLGEIMQRTFLKGNKYGIWWSSILAL
jgi:hypothetical protein